MSVQSPDVPLMPARPTTVVMTRFDFALYAMIVFGWGTSWIGMHWQVDSTVSPEVSLCWRFCLAAIVMCIWALSRGERLVFPVRQHLVFLLLGLFLFSTNLLCFYYAAQTINSGLLAVVFSLASIVNLLLGAVVLKQKIEPRVALAGVIGVIGVALMFGPEALERGGGAGLMRGLGFAAIGTMCFCSGNMVSARVQRSGVSVISANTWGMIYGSLLLAIFSLVRGQAFIIDPTLRYVGSLLWLAGPASVMAFGAYLTLLGRIGAGRAGYSTVMFPVIALAISTVAEGYVFTTMALFGLLFVLGGNLLVLTRSR